MQETLRPGPTAVETLRLIDGPAAGMRTASRRDVLWVAHRPRPGLPAPLLGPDGLVVLAPQATALDVRELHPGAVWECYMRTDMRPPVPAGWPWRPPAIPLAYQWVQRLVPVRERFRRAMERMPR